MALVFQHLKERGGKWNGRTVTDWRFEPKTFYFDGIRRGTTNYTPDFLLIDPDGYERFIEIKGWLDRKSKTKLRRMEIYHPDVHLEVIEGKAYASLAKQFCWLDGWWSNRK